MPYKPTAVQLQAWKLLRQGSNTHSLIVGGSRSGKTTLICEEILCRAVAFPNSRHLIARLRFAHAKTSIWLDTLPKVFTLEGVSGEHYKRNESDHFIKFSNGSEIWIDGLDDKERVEKILGREYNTIFFNEISQISYETVQVVLTRLAKNIPNCVNKAYYDMNPLGKLHWSYKQFVAKTDPINDKPLTRPSNYEAFYLNPKDNIDNLPLGYLEHTLEELPEHQKKRFLYGEWSTPDGVIFPSFEIIDIIPQKVREKGRPSYGLDFGFSIDPAAFVETYLIGNDLYINELIYKTGLTNSDLARLIQYQLPEGVIFADSAEPKSIEDLTRAGLRVKPARKGADSIKQGIDWLLSKNLKITRRSTNLQNELQNYCWKEDRTGKREAKPIDAFCDLIDALRYATEPYKVKTGIDYAALTSW